MVIQWLAYLFIYFAAAVWETRWISIPDWRHIDRIQVGMIDKLDYLFLSAVHPHSRSTDYAEREHDVNYSHVTKFIILGPVRECVKIVVVKWY